MATPVWAAALRAAGARVAGEFLSTQAGGPPVALAPAQLVALALEVAAWTRELATALGDYDALVDEARALRDAPDAGAIPYRNSRTRVPTEPLSVATLAVDVAYRARRNPGATGIAAAAQAAVAVRVVRQHADDRRRETAPPVRAFLVKLNDALLRLELEAALGGRAPDGVAVRVAAVLFRGAASAKGAPTLWLARLERPAAYGLLLKLGARYRWQEGERDDILATLPDDAFAAGVRAAL